MAAFPYRYAGEPEHPAPTGEVFEDVPADLQFAREIDWARQNGITIGW